MAEENPQLNEAMREQNEVPRKGNKIQLAIALAKGASIPDWAKANGVKTLSKYSGLEARVAKVKDHIRARTGKQGDEAGSEGLTGLPPEFAGGGSSGAIP